MSGKRDYYEILGIDRNSNASEIKNAFRSLARKYHPDKNQGDPESEIKFKENEKVISTLKSKLMTSQGDDLTSGAIKIKDFNFLAAKVEKIEPNELREMIDKIKTKLKTAVIILASHDHSKVSIAVGITDNLTDRFKAGVIAKTMGEQLGGKGGGRDNMAMAGGTKIDSLDLALSDIKDYLNQ